MTIQSYAPGPIPCEGAVFDDFLLTDHLPPDQAPQIIERDRLIMAARPGLNRKLLPLRIEPETNRAYCGGRYLFDTYENALAFSDWCQHEFAIDGVLILERPDFAEVTAQTYRVIGAHDFKDLSNHQVVYRTELWRAHDSTFAERLPTQWPGLRDRAAEDGKSALWLLYNEDVQEIAMVTVSDRVGARRDDELDFDSLRAVENAPSYGAEWEAEGAVAKSFDRSHWVFTIWFPNDAHAKAPRWPNSPPLPAPPG